MLINIFGFFECSNKSINANRFANIIVHASRDIFLAVAFESVGCHCDDMRLAVLCPPFAHSFGGFIAIHFWHLDIHKDDI